MWVLIPLYHESYHMWVLAHWVISHVITDSVIHITCDHWLTASYHMWLLIQWFISHVSTGSLSHITSWYWLSKSYHKWVLVKWGVSHVSMLVLWVISHGSQTWRTYSGGAVFTCLCHTSKGPVSIAYIYNRYEVFSCRTVTIGDTDEDKWDLFYCVSIMEDPISMEVY